MSNLNTNPKFFYDENFKWDSEYKIDYYQLLYNNTTEIEVNQVNKKYVGIVSPSTKLDNTTEYTFLIGKNVKKYISSSSKPTQTS